MAENRPFNFTMENNIASIPYLLKLDETTEGLESFDVTVKNSNGDAVVTASIPIVDKSLSPTHIQFLSTGTLKRVMLSQNTPSLSRKIYEMGPNGPIEEVNYLPETSIGTWVGPENISANGNGIVRWISGGLGHGQLGLDVVLLGDDGLYSKFCTLDQVINFDMNALVSLAPNLEYLTLRVTNSSIPALLVYSRTGDTQYTRQGIVNQGTSSYVSVDTHSVASPDATFVAVVGNGGRDVYMNKWNGSTLSHVNKYVIQSLGYDNRSLYWTSDNQFAAILRRNNGDSKIVICNVDVNGAVTVANTWTFTTTGSYIYDENVVTKIAGYSNRFGYSVGGGIIEFTPTEGVVMQAYATPFEGSPVHYGIYTSDTSKLFGYDTFNRPQLLNIDRVNGTLTLVT